MTATSVDAGRARDTEIVARMQGIYKAFGPLQALTDVSLDLCAGEVHALIGENGAGKSTLMNVLMGIYRPDAGEIWFEGRPASIRSPRDASDLGFGMVHQHFELIQAFTGLENIALAVDRTAHLRSRTSVRQIVDDLMERYGLTVDLGRRVADLEVGDQQKIELLRVLARKARVLLLDEPTTHLTPAEVDRLFLAVRRLAADGVAVVLISHKVREILSIADHITVLRQGRHVASLARADATSERLVTLVIGAAAREAGVPAQISQVDPSPAASASPDGTEESASGETSSNDAASEEAGGTATGAVALSLTEIATVSRGGDVALNIPSLEVRSGEIVGIAAVAGNGQRELVELVAGLRRPRTGSIAVNGRDVTRLSVADRIEHGLALLPGDRMREGILPSSPLYESLALGPHQFVARGRWRLRTIRAQAREAIEQFRVSTVDETTRTASLSGGNVQKVLLARALRVASHAPVELLVAMNPTNGLDVGASQFVYRRLEELRSRRGAVLMLSEDLEELMERCDRIVVLDKGQVTGTLGRDEFDRHRIGELMVASDV
jgi:general nucleoside transport system ATP-binding protein